MGLLLFPQYQVLSNIFKAFENISSIFFIYFTGKTVFGAGESGKVALDNGTVSHYKANPMKLCESQS